MLLVVGPSGSGKTTLIQRLQAGQPLQQLHTTVPTVGSNIVDLKIGLAKKTAVTVRELGEWHDDVAHHRSCIHLFIGHLFIYSLGNAIPFSVFIEPFIFIHSFFHECCTYLFDIPDPVQDVLLVIHSLSFIYFRFPCSVH